MRLVLFRNRERIDFSFWRLTALTEIVQGDKTYESYKNGYQVLVDKDRRAAQLPSPNGAGFSLAPPSRERFLQTLYNFWFEAYCVARHLARRDLWYAKLIESRSIKDLLFWMALWSHQAANEWKPDPILHTWGKRFEKWASAELIEAVSGCFSPYDVDETCPRPPLETSRLTWMAGLLRCWTGQTQKINPASASSTRRESGSSSRAQEFARDI